MLLPTFWFVAGGRPLKLHVTAFEDGRFFVSTSLILIVWHLVPTAVLS